MLKVLWKVTLGKIDSWFWINNLNVVIGIGFWGGEEFDDNFTKDYFEVVPGLNFIICQKTAILYSKFFLSIRNDNFK